jgi:hypothetical protein
MSEPEAEGIRGPEANAKARPVDPQPSEWSRRNFLQGLAAFGVAAAGAGGYELFEEAPVAAALHGKHSKHHKPKKTRNSAPRSSRETVDGVSLPTSQAIIAENAKTGDAWWVDVAQAPRSIEGFCNQVSAEHGDTVKLFVNTEAPTFHVEAYRMGYYQGIGGRLVWQSAEIPGIAQAPPVIVAPTNTIECRWTPSLSFTIKSTWLPGAYLLKLVGSGGQQQFVPLCVRDDTSTAAVVIQSSVTTWQAYNRWGGYSLYYGNDDGSMSFTHWPGSHSNYASRARVVSFDRPYDQNWASGAADFVGNELPVIFQAERLGMDVTYWTDVDLHARPQLLTKHHALISLGHDEYWSRPMRDGASAALNAGVNLAFLGANACYRQIRLQDSPLGHNRQQVCYKDATEDPLFGTDNSVITVNWEQAPVSEPESTLIGVMYQDVDAQANMVVTDASSWLFNGTGLTQGQQLPQVVAGEFDRYVPGAGPTNLDIIAHSRVANRRNNYSDVTWYTVAGGGGVFASGNASWVGNLVDSTLVPPNVIPEPNAGISAALLRVMENLYSVIGFGPASAVQPSQGNWTQVYAGISGVQPPPTNAA